MSARVGQFSAYTGPYGSPVPIAQPPDSVATPDPAQLAADTAKAQQNAIYESLQNAARTYTAPTRDPVTSIYDALRGL